MNSALTLDPPPALQMTTSRRGWLRWLIFAACVPIGVVLMVGAVIGFREFRAASDLRAKVKQWKQAGEPYGNASMEQWYRNRTHPEGVQAWLQILDSVSVTSQLGAVDSLPIVGNGKELSELDPQAEWFDEPKTKEYLTEMQGLIQKVHQLEKWPAPVQLPIKFNGVQTLLPHYQQSRSVTRLLQLDFEYALYHQEFERAIQDLKSIGNVAKAIDTEVCLVVDLVVSATVGARYREIQRSLLTDNWPPEKLSELRELLGQARYSAAKWKALFACERAMFGDDVVAGDLSRITGAKEASLLPLMQTGKLRIFEAYDDLINIGNAELADLKSASKLTIDRITKRDSTFDMDASGMWIGVLLPGIEPISRAMENEESNRRLTLTAVALRQFKHQAGRWPSRLSELESVGLKPADYSTVNRGGLGYETTDGAAYLWGSDQLTDSPVGRTRPNVDTDRPNVLNLVTLR